MRTFVRILALALGSLLIALPLVPASAQAGEGALFALSNDPAGNQVVVFHRAADGTLSAAGSVPTGGIGSGDGLGSQGAVVLSDDGGWLVAVNAGSNDVSVLSVGAGGLEVTDVESSGGTRPTSVTIHGSLIYVLNDGSDDVSGLRLGTDGSLTPVAGSTKPLSGTGIDPAQIEFTNDGRKLVVTEKNTNLIDVYKVRGNGSLGGRPPQPSEGETPFGFAFDPSGHLIVSEAFGGAAGASAVSSYSVGGNGALATVSASVPDGQAAACWIAVTPDGAYAYTTNTGSGTISAYSIGADGSLTLFPGDPFAAGGAPADMTIAGGGHFLYARNGDSQDISAYAVNADGTLTSIAGIGGLPPAAAGLAGW